MGKTFKVTSGFIVASDPCYELPTWCQGVVPAKNGDWEVHVELDEIDGRVKNISAWNIEAALDNHNITNDVFYAGYLPHSFGVDSGQFGYFDRAAYRNDDAITPEIPTSVHYDSLDRNETGEKFYSACCEATISEKYDTVGYGVFPFGLVSGSGWGDGSYPTTGIQDKDGNYIALATVFIDDNYDDDDMDEDDDDIFEDDDTEDEDK